MKTHLRYFLGLVLALGLFVATPAKAFVGISVGIAPPPLPICVQPACPGDGYLWTPGYWGWGDGQYYWVPGAWAYPPEIGFLWTPCWWGWGDGAYCFHSGYWGRHVGFYGGIAYGNGYGGRGYDGGRWRGNHFDYNRDANNVRGIDASRTFSRGVASNGSRVSFNGHGGTTAVATADERRAGDEHHIGATSAQNAEARSALADPAQRYSVNHGNPQVTGTARAGSFHGTSASAATGATREERNASTGESRTASSSARLNRAGGESAFTGESRTASSSARLNRTGSENAFTGESRSASEHRSQVASEERRTAATRSAGAERTASTERSHVSESHFATRSSHESSYHAASSFREPSSFHSSSYSHSGGFGGGRSFAHASVSHGGGGGGFHGGGGGGGHGGGHGGGGGGHR